MTAKVIVPALALLMAAVWSPVQACPGGDHSHSAAPGKAVAGYSDAHLSHSQMSYSDGEWSGRWIAGEWTPGYWHEGTWRAAELDNDTWVARVNDNGTWTTFELSEPEWSAMPQGKVMGYSDADRGDVKGYSDARAHGAADGYHEGAKCHGDVRGYHGHGCGCECRIERRGCYDCWGVWQTDDMYDFEAIRESDYDPVMGRGDSGGGWFW